MGENYYKINEDGTVDKMNGAPNGNKRDNDPFTAIFLGIGVSIVSAGIMAGVGILFESEIPYLIIIGTLIAGVVSGTHLTNKVFAGILGVIFGVVTYTAYILILDYFGYAYADGEQFSKIWILVAAIAGAISGYGAAEDSNA